MNKKDQQTILLSVLLPVYNAEHYLTLALESLLEQTFHDFEIIAINDGSIDRSGQILDEFAKKDSRIRVFHRKQSGLIVTLNEGIDLARGEWIARMDADDIALPNRFELQLAQLSRTGADFCGGALKCFGESKAIWRYPDSNEACGVMLLFGVPFAHPAVIGRAKVFKDLRYDPRFTHAEDYELWQRAWQLGYVFTNVNDLILRYRVHQKQVSRTYFLEQSIIADAVRVRHWKHLCPSLNQDFKLSIFLEPASGESNSLLIREIHKLLLRIPKSSHLLYLNGILRILIRRTCSELGVLKQWIILCNSAHKIPWATKWYGVSILLFLTIAKVETSSNLFNWLRTVKNKIIKLL